MSWYQLYDDRNGFVKAVNRATTSVMQSTGRVEKTVDKDFEGEEERFKKLEGRIEKLHVEAKGYLDAVRKMTLAQKDIAETIDRFYDDNSGLGKASKDYKEAMLRMDEEVRGELDETYRITVMDPIGKLVGVLPFVNETIKKRSKKLLDYDRARTTVKKLIEKPSDDPSKLTKAEAEANFARNLYEPLNNQLITEIPLLINMQVPYLNPSFEAIVKSQLAFNEGAYYKLDAIKKSFANELNSVGLEGRAETALQKMKELSICKRFAE